MMKTIYIKLAGKELEYPNGDKYDYDTILEALNKFCSKKYPSHKLDISICNYIQENEMNEDGYEAYESFFSLHASDEELFV